MAILQTKKQSDLEKRLKILRQQIYGKEIAKTRMTQKYSDKKEPDSVGTEGRKTSRSDALTIRYSDPPSNSESFRSDITYLRGDLAKISLLASVALGIQVLLYFLIKNHILNFIKI